MFFEEGEKNDTLLAMVARSQIPFAHIHALRLSTDSMVTDTPSIIQEIRMFYEDF